MVDLSNIETYDAPVPDTAPMSDDLTCQICDAPLFYGGKGRKPKFCDEHKQSRSTGAARKTSSGSTVDAAMASLAFCEDLLSIPLLMLSPNAAKEWVTGLPALRAKNRAILSGNPALCKSIAKTSSKVSPYMLLGSYGYALSPVVKVVAQDVRARRANRDDDPVSPVVNLHKNTPPNDVDAMVFGVQS